jgi:PAS domain S-box-containing protein
MTSISIINRLRLLLAVPMLIILIGSFFYGYHLYTKLNALHTLNAQVIEIEQAAEMMHELQKERGLNSLLLAEKNASLFARLEKQRLRVDDSLKKLRAISSYKASPFADCSTELDNLSHFRNLIDTAQVKPSEAFTYYTRLIGQMRSDYLSIVLTVGDISLRNDFQAYTNLMAIKETLGQMQSGLSTAFTQQKMDTDLYVQLILSKGEHDTALGRYETLASPAMKQLYHEQFSGGEVDTVYRIIHQAIKSKERWIAMDPTVWFRLSEHSVDTLRDLEKHNFAFIEETLFERIFEAKEHLLFVALLLVLTLAMIFWMGYKISEGIRWHIKLLDEYKNAVDRSSIVSKTDRKGKITYTNDQFCAISGYTKEELIGCFHNIVRHEDSPKEVFKEMWKTILSGNPWHGVVKNKTKSGTYYWVDATINPILNHKGKIEEFIAIRSDITDTIRLHEELEQTQQEMISRIGEIGETRSRETGYHVRRVAEYSRLLAKLCGLNENEVTILANASPMHDIGKVGIPDHILNKPGTLTSQEWEVMRTHCKIGYDLFRDSERPLLKAASIISHEHHEKYDGSGYPRGIRGENIHIFGRITAIADVFDALGSDRCYKKAWEIDRILEHLKNESGKHFDPVLIDLFFRHLDQFLAIRSAYSEKNYAASND